ncbi:MAG: flagellar basal body L-ring protein FlgH [Desulfobulbaceae bacterium]|nr:flagellar basal body L-ring protein FlgH [Desulfobulbaceae bacterium]
MKTVRFIKLYLFYVISLWFLLLHTGCTEHQPKIVTLPEPLEPTITTPGRPQSPGSLWNDNSSELFTDIKARTIGDIVTVTISEKASASKAATTETDRDTSISAGIPSFFGIEETLENRSRSTMSSLVNASLNNQFSGSGRTTREENLVATLTTQVTGVYPNGNMKIRGGKSVIVNNEEQIIYLTGIVRPKDVNADNTVDSKFILNAQIAYTGKGAISDKQKPGWMMRILDNVWPF